MIKNVTPKELKKILKAEFGWFLDVEFRNEKYILYGRSEIESCVAKIGTVKSYEHDEYDCKYQTDEILVELHKLHPNMACCYVKGIDKKAAGRPKGHAWPCVIISTGEVIHLDIRKGIQRVGEVIAQVEVPYVDTAKRNYKKFPSIQKIRF